MDAILGLWEANLVLGYLLQKANMALRYLMKANFFEVIRSRSFKYGISRQKFKFQRVKSPRAVTSNSSIMNSLQKSPNS